MPKSATPPGESVTLTFLVTDEAGRAVPAALGVSVKSDTTPPFSGRRHVGPGTSNIAVVPSAAKACAPGYFNADLDIADTAPADLDRVLDARMWPASIERPPLMYDNLEQISTNYEEALAEYQADRTGLLNTLTAASFFGGLGLVILVAMLGLMRIVSGIHLWVSAVGATTCCMILGAILMDPGRLAPNQASAAAFTTYLGQPPPAVHVAQPPPAVPNESSQPGAESSQPGAAVLHDAAETVYWRPLLIAGPDGKAELRFDVPRDAAALDVSVVGHGEGRLGADQTTIAIGSPPAATNPQKPQEKP